MRMSEAQLAARTMAFPEIFADRVPETDLAGLRSMAGGGEWANCWTFSSRRCV